MPLRTAAFRLLRDHARTLARAVRQAAQRLTAQHSYFTSVKLSPVQRDPVDRLFSCRPLIRQMFDASIFQAS